MGSSYFATVFRYTFLELATLERCQPPAVYLARRGTRRYRPPCSAGFTLSRTLKVLGALEVTQQRR